MQHIIDLLNSRGDLRCLSSTIKLESSGFMPLTIEHIGTDRYYHPTAQLVSVAHYGKQNGDLMRDPELVFAAMLDDKGMVLGLEAVYFRNDYLGIETCAYDGNYRNEKLIRSWGAFAKAWDRNLTEQGFFGETGQPKEPGFFGRLGAWADVRVKMMEAERKGALVIHDRSAGTVVATLEGKTLFKAADKGAGDWIVLYSTAYYPQ